jgi:hypothetical protein
MATTATVRTPKKPPKPSRATNFGCLSGSASWRPSIGNMFRFQQAPHREPAVFMPGEKTLQKAAGHSELKSFIRNTYEPVCKC